jgi:hypothetical protein
MVASVIYMEDEESNQVDVWGKERIFSQEINSDPSSIAVT